MSFIVDGEEDRGGNLPDIVGTITNVGINYRKYDNGNDEHRLVVIVEPETKGFKTQTITLSTYNILKVKSDPSVVHVGGSENGFDLEILGSVIEEGKLGYKAAVWMKKLKELGVQVPEDSGDLRELIGVKSVFRQMTYNEAKGRKVQEREKPFWMPIEIVPTAQMAETDVVNADFEVVEDDLEEVSKTPQISLYDAVLAVAPGTAQKELEEWFKKSVYIGESESVVQLYMELWKLEQEGVLNVQNGIYVRSGIKLGDSETLGVNIED